MSGAVTSRFVYGSSARTPDYVVRASGTLRVVRDHLGSPRALVDSSTGAVVQSIDFDAWGVPLANTGGTWSLPIGFAAGHYDPETGLVRFGARDYDPSVGLWTSKDPLLFGSGQTNLYSYVNANPINAFDPDGRAPVCNYSGQPLLVEGSTGPGHGHPGQKDVYAWVTLMPGQCISGDEPYPTTGGDLRDVDAVDFDGDNILKHPMGRQDYGNGKIPGTDWGTVILWFGPKYFGVPAGFVFPTFKELCEALGL
jgi:RHS repeat-associated protein